MIPILVDNTIRIKIRISVPKTISLLHTECLRAALTSVKFS